MVKNVLLAGFSDCGGSRQRHAPLRRSVIIAFLLYSKKDSNRSAVFFREGISFLWGIAKNYIMYWGVTSSIIA